MKQIVLLGLAMLALFPFLVYWHEFLHSIPARLYGWPFQVILFPGGGRIAETVVEVQSPTRTQLFFFAAAPRLFDLAILLILPWLTLLKLPWLTFGALALIGCWCIDFVFESLGIFGSERFGSDSWNTFRPIDNRISLGYYRVVSAVLSALVTTAGLVFWHNL
jgi:hypothetical protein